MKRLCSYGCGSEGIFILKNGKCCCHRSWNQCPANRKKNSEKTKKTNQFPINANTIKVVCKWCGKEIGKCNIKKHEKYCYLTHKNIRLCPICNTPIKNYKTGKTCSSKCARIFFSKMYKEYGRKGKNLTYRTLCFDFHKKECIICKEKNIIDVHHYDENKDNNDPRNLVPLCPTHHMYLHSRHRLLIIKEVKNYVKNFKILYELKRKERMNNVIIQNKIFCNSGSSVEKNGH